MDRDIINHFKLKKMEERIDAGKAPRIILPDVRQGNYNPTLKYEDPVFFLEPQGKIRMKNLVLIRYKRMLPSPFPFLNDRTANMAADLNSGTETTGITVQAYRLQQLQEPFGQPGWFG